MTQPALAFEWYWLRYHMYRALRYFGSVDIHVRWGVKNEKNKSDWL